MSEPDNSVYLTRIIELLCEIAESQREIVAWLGNVDTRKWTAQKATRGDK